jgi:CRISPR system Cascade subunit CasB
MAEHETDRSAIRDHVARLISELQRRYLPSGARARPEAYASAMLARLRQTPADDVASGSSFALLYDRLPERLISDLGAPTRAESAIHAALVLYAGHQQSRGEPMHVPGRSLGRAARDLAMSRGGAELDEAMVARFHRVATATGPGVRLAQLRSLISLFRAHSIPLDYARLACDLYDLDYPASADRVRLRWGRDLHSRTTEPLPAQTPSA